MSVNNCGVVETILRERKCAIVFGAGLSRHSGIPTVYDFLDEFCRVLSFDHNDALRKIPFEYLMSQLRLSANPLSLYKIFDVGGPNRNHHFLSGLGARGVVKYFVTTNFDGHLERAFRQGSCDFRLIYEKGELRDVQSLPDGVTLFKLHGSIESPATIDVTLQSVSNFVQKELVAVPLKLLCEDENVEHLLFLGYSRSDVFDIEPVLKSSGGNVKLVTWSHSDDDPREVFVGEDEYERVVGRGAGEVVLKGSTDLLIAHLCEAFSIPEEGAAQDRDAWKDLLRDWWSNLSVRDQLVVVANLHATIGEVSESLRLYSEAFNGGHPGSDVESMPSIACNIGIRLNNLGRHEDALRYLDFAIERSEDYWMPVESGAIPAGRSTLLTAMLEKYESLTGLKRHDEAGQHLFRFWYVLRGSPEIAPLPFKLEVHPLEPEAHYWAWWLVDFSHLFRILALEQSSAADRREQLEAAMRFSLSAMEIAEKGGHLAVFLAALINHIHLLIVLSEEQEDESLLTTAREFYNRSREINRYVQPFTSEEAANTTMSLQLIHYRLVMGNRWRERKEGESS